MPADTDDADSKPGSGWGKVVPVPSGRQEHWLDRIAAQDDAVEDGSSFLPNVAVKRITLSRDASGITRTRVND